MVRRMLWSRTALVLCVTLLVAARGRAEEPVPAPASPIVAEATPDEAEPALPPVSKEAPRPTDKIDHRGKIKECCGYPIGLPLSFRLSFYWLAWESDYAWEPRDTDIYTRDGLFIGRFPQAFVFELKLEGSGVLQDGRVLNYDGGCSYGMGTCFRTTDPGDHPLGAGVQGRALQPFRSIAVDPRYIPIGSTVWVPELAGIEMPDGTKHDGCLRADDQGGAIKQQKLDFFVESYRNFKFIADNLWWKLKATPHLEEPRCAYLRVPSERDRLNERIDYLTMKFGGAKMRAATAAALKKIAHSRQKATAWVKRRVDKR